jgi:hypothetical protein
MTELEQIAALIRKVISDLEQQIAKEGRLPMWQEPLLNLATELERAADRAPTDVSEHRDPNMPPGSMS